MIGFVVRRMLVTAQIDVSSIDIDELQRLWRSRVRGQRRHRDRGVLGTS